jgi:hypothetical protein
MQQIVQANEQAEENSALLEEYDRRDQAEANALMARHASHIFEAETGYTAAEIREAQARQVDALAEVGFDAQAAVGSPQHPEVLIDGASIYPSRGPEVDARVSRARYGEVDGLDALLAEHEAGRQAWESDPRLLRQRWLSQGR